MCDPKISFSRLAPNWSKSVEYFKNILSLFSVFSIHFLLIKSFHTGHYEDKLPATHRLKHVKGLPLINSFQARGYTYCMLVNYKVAKTNIEH